MTVHRRQNARPQVVEALSELPPETRERLVELSVLGPDWDGYGALRPAQQAITRAGTFAGQVIASVGPEGAPHEIMPIADGAIQLEWRFPQLELGLNACVSGGWSYLLVDKRGDERRFEEGYDLSDEAALDLAFRVLEQHRPG
jgi:hypothetical protein